MPVDITGPEEVPLEVGIDPSRVDGLAGAWWRISFQGSSVNGLPPSHPHRGRRFVLSEPPRVDDVLHPLLRNCGLGKLMLHATTGLPSWSRARVAACPARCTMSRGRSRTVCRSGPGS